MPTPSLPGLDHHPLGMVLPERDWQQEFPFELPLGERDIRKDPLDEPRTPVEAVTEMEPWARIVTKAKDLLLIATNLLKVSYLLLKVEKSLGTVATMALLILKMQLKAGTGITQNLSGISTLKDRIGAALKIKISTVKKEGLLI